MSGPRRSWTNIEKKSDCSCITFFSATVILKMDLTRTISSLVSIGFRRYSFTPRLNPRSMERESRIKPVRKITGMSFVFLWTRMRESVSKPSKPGIRISRSTRSIFSLSNIPSPSSPVIARNTPYPSWPSTAASASTLDTSSSIMRMEYVSRVGSSIVRQNRKIAQELQGYWKRRL